jgi:hypothetical protein
VIEILSATKLARARRTGADPEPAATAGFDAEFGRLFLSPAWAVGQNG